MLRVFSVLVVVSLAALTSNAEVASGASSFASECDGSLFLVDVPVDKAVPQHHVAASLSAKARLGALASRSNWFTEPCAQVEVRLDDVFKDTPGLLEPRRHQRLSFACDGAAMSIRADRQCEALSRVKALFVEAYGEDKAALNVSRDCQAVRQAPDSARGIVSIAPGEAARASASDVLVGIIDTPRGTEHGDAVETLIRSSLGAAARKVELDRVEVLSTRKGTPTSALAAAIGRFAARLRPEDRRPVVLNMSFGWPPELSQHRVLSGEGCAVSVGPVGEAVRSALLALRTKRPNSHIFAAAGNRTRRVRAPVGSRGYGVCGPEETTAMPFFPAAWSRPAGPACADPRLRRSLLTSVAATGSRAGFARADVSADGRHLGKSGSSYATARVSGQTTAKLVIGADAVTVAPAPATAVVKAQQSPPITGVVEGVVKGPRAPRGLAARYAFGPVRTLPGEEPCIGPGCNGLVQTGLTKLDFEIELSTYFVAAPGTPHIISAYFVIDDGVNEYQHALSATWQTGSFLFKDIDLPTSLHGSESAIKAADYWFRYKLDDGTTVDWYDDDVPITLP